MSYNLTPYEIRSSRTSASTAVKPAPVRSGIAHSNGDTAHKSTPQRLEVDHEPRRPRNRLLASLPRTSWERLAPHVRHALLIPGQVLVEANQPATRAYFPNSGLISLAMISSDGAQVEVGMAGREGTTATLESLTGAQPLTRALVQIAGNACWIPLETMRSEFQSDPVLRDCLLRYWCVISSQAAHSSLCNRLHSVDERLCRWLILVRDRTQSNEIEITHEFIAHALGARRSGVTVALGTLQQSGYIDCTRGKVTILDSDGLKKSACDCCRTLSDQFDSLEIWQEQLLRTSDTTTASFGGFSKSTAAAFSKN
jgi:CRP-like cAMP-binding protein